MCASTSNELIAIGIADNGHRQQTGNENAEQVPDDCVYVAHQHLPPTGID